MIMITKETAREIYNHYSQIETVEKLISDMKKMMEKEKGTSPDILRDNSYHPHGSIQMHIPYFEAGSFNTERGSRVYNISYPSAIRVLKNHIKQLKRELNKLQEDAKQ